MKMEKYSPKEKQKWKPAASTCIGFILATGTSLMKDGKLITIKKYNNGESLSEIEKLNKIIMQLSNSEEQLMEHLWKLEKAFMKDFLEAYPKPKPATTTVATFIEKND